MRVFLGLWFLVAVAPFAIASGIREETFTYANAPLVHVSDCDGNGIFQGLAGMPAPVLMMHACSIIQPGETEVTVRVDDATGRPVSFIFGFRGSDGTRHVYCGVYGATEPIPAGATKTWIAFDPPVGGICGPGPDRAATAGTITFSYR